MIIQVSIDQEDYIKLKTEADKQRLSVSSLARSLIVAGLMNRKITE